MNETFLRELAENINLSFRSHADTDKETLVKLLNKKISPEKADTVFKMYLTCFKATEVAQAIKPKGMEEITSAVENFFKLSSLDCLYEVTVGSHRCDIVLFVENDIIAVEVKSAQDQMKTAASQLKYYSTWADKVFLAYDSKHRRTIDKLGLKEKGIGLLEFNKGKLKSIQNASFQEKNADYRLSLMTYDYLRNIARAFSVGIEGKKQDMAERLSRKLSASQAKTIFKDFLKTRSLR
jgi:hypothetical protein